MALIFPHVRDSRVKELAVYGYQYPAEHDCYGHSTGNVKSSLVVREVWFNTFKAAFGYIPTETILFLW